MAFEVLSTQSWNVLGTFAVEEEARQAVRSSLSEGGAEPEHLLVSEVEDGGTVVREFSGSELAEWSGQHVPA
jgi:hypothetical protein